MPKIGNGFCSINYADPNECKEALKTAYAKGKLFLNNHNLAENRFEKVWCIDSSVVDTKGRGSLIIPDDPFLRNLKNEKRMKDAKESGTLNRTSKNQIENDQLQTFSK